MAQGQAPYPVGQPAQVVLPAVVQLQVDLGVGVQLVDDQVNDAVEQAFPAGHVPVQRHRFDTSSRPSLRIDTARTPSSSMSSTAARRIRT